MDCGPKATCEQGEARANPGHKTETTHFADASLGPRGLMLDELSYPD